ncbi:MAG: alpha/beta fold hydrolase [Rhodocyclaceae bacterium]|nr:alpha/beta fold hydrolase [Rhodocyclaceae bacterium]
MSKSKPRSPDVKDAETPAAADSAGSAGPAPAGKARRIAGGATRVSALALEQEARLIREIVSILAGNSDVEPERGDKRFTDDAWKNNPFMRIWMQGYLSWARALGNVVDGVPLTDRNRERLRFLVSTLVDAAAPTNTLIGNPTALRKMVDTGGGSVVQGVRNMVADLTNNKGMPTQVDKAKFRVGGNLATTPGAVVYRNEVLEVLQYGPVTKKVHARPQLMVPPQINKYYIFDMAPGKSIIEFLVAAGLQVFAVSWRNPGAEHADWDMDTYVSALREAIAAVREITGADDVNVHGACSGAMTMSCLMGYDAATGATQVHAATMMVAVLDGREESQLGLFTTPQVIALAKRSSASKGVIEGHDMGRVFAWMRPNDLIWNYWVNNYLMGNAPPAFDVLYWNNDTTRLPARFHADLMDIFVDHRLTTPKRMTVLGEAVDLRQVGCECYVLAGISDHITPWQGVFNTSRQIGGRNTFVLSSSGHVQSLINPPGNAKARYFVGDESAVTADDWLDGAQAAAGSWWEHWKAWLVARSGPKVDAPVALGSAKHPELEAAPGLYVLER